MGVTKTSGEGKNAAKKSVTKPTKVDVKHALAEEASSESKSKKTAGSGLDEIESLFAEKKKQKQEQEQTARAHKKQAQKHGPSPDGKKRGAVGGAAAASSGKNSKNKDDWINDGLGGVYNSEGYTGRVEDGVKIFKTHLLQSAKSGTTPDCPFDCDCCFI